MAQLQTTVVGDGADIVLLHGWGMNSRVWAALLPKLSARFRVTCIDLPGHGGSEAVEAPTVGVWVDALLAAAPPQAIWLGWSLGGMLAISAATARPDRVKGVVTVASNLRFVAGGGWPWGVSRQLFDDMVSGIAENPEETLRRFVALQFLGVRAGAEMVRQLRAAVVAEMPSRQALLAGLDLLRDLDLRRDVSTCRAPLRMIFGGRDKLVPPDVATVVTDHAPTAEVAMLDQAGHASFLTHPEAFVSLLMPMLEVHAS